MCIHILTGNDNVFMANRSRISIAKPKIEAYINATQKKVFKPSFFETMLSLNNLEWRLAASTSVKDCIAFLLERSQLKQVVLKFPSQSFVRYIWGEEEPNTVYDIALSLKPNSYLSHYTAVFYHELTEQIPKNIFVTFEQPRKNQADVVLSQAAIDAAFQKPVKSTTNVAVYKDYNITLLNGQDTAGTGILKQKTKDGLELPFTNLERTLIDIAVRPVYAGGILEVLKAYEAAKDKVQVNKLKSYLKKIDYIYPYHQVIGFYLEKAGISDKRLAYIEEGWHNQFDFYLTHDMNEVKYSSRWKLYYPSYID